MESTGKSLLKLLLERDPASPQFRSGVQTILGLQELAAELPSDADLDLWRDVFVQQKLPWGRFLQSVLLHATAIALLYTISLAWIRQRQILDRAAFDRSSLITYTPEDYLPPLDTGASDVAKVETGDPVYAKQPILSVPPEADNRSQTIVVPPDLKLKSDVAMPNIIATGAIVPAVPLDATRAPSTRLVAPEMQVVAPAPDVQFAPDRVVQAAMKSDVIAPPPELTASTKGQIGLVNIGPSEVVAPAPQLTLTEQHALGARGKGRVPGGAVQPVGPPPSLAASGGSAGGRLIALGIHPVAATGTGDGSRRQSAGKVRRGSAGKTRRFGNARLGGIEIGSEGLGRRDGSGNARNHGSLPAGLHVGAPESGGTASAGTMRARWLAPRRRERGRGRGLRLRFPTIRSPTWTGRFLAASACMRRR